MDDISVLKVVHWSLVKAMAMIIKNALIEQ